MIQLTWPSFFTLYLATLLFILFFAWIKNSRSREKQLSVPSDNLLYVCEYCQYTYLESASMEITQCPQCKAYNKHNSYC